MNLSTGARIHRRQWTELPITRDVVDRVHYLADRSHAPEDLAFAWRDGSEITGTIQDYGNDDGYGDEDYVDSGEEDVTELEYDDSEDDLEASSDGEGAPTTEEEEGGVGHHSLESDVSSEDESGVTYGPAETEDDGSTPGESPDDDYEEGTDEVDDSFHDDDYEGTDYDDGEDGVDDVDVSGETAGVAESAGVAETTGVAATAGVDGDAAGPDPEVDDSLAARMDARYGSRGNRYNLRPRRERSYDHRTMHMAVTVDEDVGENEKLSQQGYTLMTMGDSVTVGEKMSLSTEQMSLRQGLKEFGKDAEDAVVAEFKQLHDRNVASPRMSHMLSREEKRRALQYLMFLKRKRCGRVKARGCADGRPQRLYKSKEDTSSPTVRLESILLSSMIDAHERRTVVTCDIPGAFMQTDIDEIVHVRLEGKMAELLTKVDPNKYVPYLTEEKGKQVLYVVLNKALYGTLQGALLFWKDLSSYLTKTMGFTANKYDSCVVNKRINGKQCTILWHVDDLKISHVDPAEIEDVISQLESRFAKTDPLSMTRGKVHEFLGMTLDFSVDGEFSIKMGDYVEKILGDVPADMEGTAVTPAKEYLFNVNEDSPKLDDATRDMFHHKVAQLLFLAKRARPDLQTGVSFLTTRVCQPDRDDYGKLGRLIKYLRGSKDLYLTLRADNLHSIRWWVDASFAVHRDMRSHTGSVMTMGKGGAISNSTRQKLNTRSSTEAELVGVDDTMPMIIWVRLFMEEQGYTVKENIVYQDNQSAILLERNGTRSSTKRTRHLDVRYYFVTDRVNKKELTIEYCPTKDMWADVNTKPLQGSAFRRMRRWMLNCALLDNEDVPAVDHGATAGPQECVETRVSTSGTEVGSRPVTSQVVDADESAAVPEEAEAVGGGGECHRFLRTQGSKETGRSKLYRVK